MQRLEKHPAPVCILAGLLVWASLCFLLPDISNSGRNEASNRILSGEQLPSEQNYPASLSASGQIDENRALFVQSGNGKGLKKILTRSRSDTPGTYLNIVPNRLFFVSSFNTPGDTLKLMNRSACQDLPPPFSAFV